MLKSVFLKMLKAAADYYREHPGSMWDRNETAKLKEAILAAKLLDTPEVQKVVAELAHRTGQHGSRDMLDIMIAIEEAWETYPKELEQ